MELDWGPWIKRDGLVGLAMRAGFLALGLVLIVASEGSLLMILSGAILVFVTAAFILQRIWLRKTVPNPVVVIDENGLLDRRILTQPLPWSALKDSIPAYSGSARDDEVGIVIPIRAGRFDLAHFTGYAKLWERVSLGFGDLTLVTKTLNGPASREIWKALCAFRRADLDNRVAPLQAALARLAAAHLAAAHLAAEGVDSDAFDEFADQARDALFHYPLGGFREEETWYRTDDDGHIYLDLFTDLERYDVLYRQSQAYYTFLESQIDLLARRDGAYLRFDPGSDSEFVLKRKHFPAMLARL